MGYIGASPLGLTLNTTPGSNPTVGRYEKNRISDDRELYQSLFRNNKFAIYSKGTDDKGKVTGTETNLHDNEVYDTSIISILTETGKQQSTALSAADFAYLKNLGVFPNNRLMIARRFPAPIGNDLTSIRDTTPLSTLISWVPDGENFISFSFGEVWEDNSEGDFKTVLNDIGKGVLGGDNQGGKLGDEFYKGFNAIPLAGFMESLQYSVLEKMGLTSKDNTELLPGGNPNLIRKSMMRRLVKDGSTGSGLKCKFTIKMTVEYELKFIDGVDPTLTYFDIISNILSFASSNSTFQFNGNFANKNNKLLQNFISGDNSKLLSGIAEFATKLIEAITSVANKFLGLLGEIFKPVEKEEEGANAQKTFAEKILNGIIGAISADSVGKFIKKFRVRILAIISAMTGTPSTPWHITIGNPKRPIFSSGDMYIQDDVKVDLGPILQFNDLPSSIKCEFTLVNARPLGAQEIYERFNNGEGRTYKRLNLSFEESELNLLAIGTQSDTSALIDDQKYPRDQFGFSTVTDNSDQAVNRQGASGNIVETSNQINSSTIISTSPLPEEGDIESPILVTAEYTYNVTLIGNSTFRVTVANNINKQPIEFNWSISSAPDAGTAILLTQNIMDSSGTYQNNINYPKSGTKITIVN
jgi:hypothetical protein